MLPYVGSRLTMKGNLNICLYICNVVNAISACLVPVNMFKYQHLTRSKTLVKDRSLSSSVKVTGDHDCHDPFCE
jgi:cell division protein FtsL